MFEYIDQVQEALNDLESVPTILRMMDESFSLEKTNWNELDEWRISQFHIQADQVINLSIKIILDSIKKIDDAMKKKEDDSDESEATTETTKNQK